MIDEVWKPVPGSNFEASNLGRVRRWVIVGLGPVTELHPYPRVWFRRGPRMRQAMIHRLVAEAFLGECPEGYVVNHIDGNKSNNNIQNLEYVLKRENSTLAAAQGLYLSGKDHPRSVLTEQQEVEISQLYKSSNLTMREIAERFSVSKSTVSRIVRGNRYG